MGKYLAASASTAGIITVFANAMGGLDYTLLTLVGFMVVDFFTGIVVAAVFKQSKNTAKNGEGGLSSEAMTKGFFKKGMMLLIVYMAVSFDTILEVEFVRYTVIIGFLVNEALSIIENAGIMGLPLPEGFTKAIDVLKNREGEKLK